MKKINRIFVVFLVIFCSVALAGTLRGRPGSPTEATMNSTYWRNFGPFELSPERGRFGLIYSIVENNSLYFSVPIAQFSTPDLGYINGNYVSLFAPAVSYLAIPGYIIGKVFGSSQLGAFATVSVFALFNMLLIVYIAKRLGASFIAGSISGLVFLFATPAFGYGVTLYQHHISTFLLLASVALLIRYKGHILSLLAVFFLIAFSLPVDYPNMVLFLPVLGYMMPHFISFSYRHDVTINLLMWKWISVIGVIVPLLFFFWFNHQSYGNPLQLSGTVESVSRVDEKGNPAINLISGATSLEDVIKSEKQEKGAIKFFQPRDLLNGLYILLVSPDRGLLVFAPVLIAALAGIGGLLKTKSKEAVLLISIIASNIVLYAMWGDPWGGWAFGARYLIPSYALLSIFIAFALMRWRRNIVILGLFLSLAGFSVYINTAGALTSNANPPQVQILGLEQITKKQERYSFDRNVQAIHENKIRSFAYNAWVSKYLGAREYFYLIVALITGVMLLLTIFMYASSRKEMT